MLERNMSQNQNCSRTITHRAVLFTMISRKLRTEGQEAMSNAIQDVEFGDRELAAPAFMQLKPAGDGRSIVVAFLGKMKASAYHWLPKKMKGYRCNGDGCPACAAGMTQSWSA